MAQAKRSTVSIKNATIVKRADYHGVLKKIEGERICPFCEKNFLLHHPKPLLFKTTHWLVTENGWPYKGAREHLLFVLRRHIERSEELTPKEWADLGTAYARIARTRALKGATLFMRSGDMNRTGASVRHLHAQVVSGNVYKKGAGKLTVLAGFKK